MSERKKRQHYVPKFYLKNFTHNDKKLFALDKFSRAIFPTNVEDIANERYFYNIPPGYIDEEKMQIVEDDLSRIEAKFAEAFDRFLLAVEHGETFSESDQCGIAFFLATQMIRTREFRNHMKAFIELTTRAILDIQFNLKGINISDYELKLNEDIIRLKHLFLIVDNEWKEEIVNILMDHLWFIGKNITQEPFYTSDTPVIIKPHKKDTNLSYSGIASEGIEIVCPLNSEYILILRERRFFVDLVELDGNVIECEPDNVMYYNSLQVLRSHRQVYCKSNSFDFANQVCDENPKVCKPQNRVNVDTYTNPLFE